jgi:hypothetical protein
MAVDPSPVAAATRSPTDAERHLRAPVVTVFTRHYRRALGDDL